MRNVKRYKEYNVCAKCHDGKIVMRTGKFTQTQCSGVSLGIVLRADGLTLEQAKQVVEHWNWISGAKGNYTYSIDV